MHEKCGGPDSNGFQLKWRFGTYGYWNSWGLFWSYQLNCQFSPFGPSFEVNGLDWQCYLAGSSKRAKRAPTILIFSIAMGAKYLPYVKSVATFAPTFYGYVYHFRLSKCGQDNIFFVSYKPKQVLARIFRVSRREELVCYVTIFC